jgi:hypothetical protein
MSKKEKLNDSKDSDAKVEPKEPTKQNPPALSINDLYAKKGFLITQQEILQQQLAQINRELEKFLNAKK